MEGVVGGVDEVMIDYGLRITDDGLVVRSVFKYKLRITKYG